MAIHCYRVRTTAPALEDIPGAVDVPFYSRRVHRWEGAWTFTVVTGRPDLLTAWLRGNPHILSWQDETASYQQAQQ